MLFTVVATRCQMLDFLGIHLLHGAEKDARSQYGEGKHLDQRSLSRRRMSSHFVARSIESNEK